MPRQFWLDHNWRALWHRHPQLVAYILVVLVTITGFWRISAVQAEQHRLSEARFDVACDVLNQNKDLVQAFTDALVKVSQSNPPLNQTEEDKHRQALALKQFLGLIQPKLQHLNCHTLGAHPERFLHQGAP